jgi:uncharacterized protein YggE
MAQSGGPPSAPPVPQLHVTASEYVEIAPDRAVVTLTVESRARTATAAGAENARIQTAVLDTLGRLGIARTRIRTQGVNVMPEYRYPDEGGRPTVVGYQARHTIHVEIEQLGKVSGVIDGALAKGVTSVGGLQFYASTADEARRAAIAKAVARARAEAGALASAAGGSVGAVLELSANTETPDPGQGGGAVLFRQAREAAASMPTPVEAGLIRVTAFVSAKYAFTR